MPPKIESQPIVLFDTSFESFSNIPEQASSVSLARNDRGVFHYRPDTRTVAEKRAEVLDGLKQSLLNHYTATGSHLGQAYDKQQPDVASKRITNILDSVIKGYQNKETSGKNIHELMGKADTYVKSLAFSTKQFKNAAKEAAASNSSVYVRLNASTQTVELHTRSFTGRVGHSIAKFFGSSDAKEQDSMTREILKAAIQTREEARAAKYNTKAMVSQNDIASAVRLIPEGDVLQGATITAVFAQLKSNRHEVAEKTYMQGIVRPLNEGHRATDTDDVDFSAYPGHRVKDAMDDVATSNLAYYPESNPVRRDIASSTINQGQCLLALAKELSDAGLVDKLVKQDFLTTREDSQIPRLKNPAEFLLHFLKPQGVGACANNEEALLARYLDRDSNKFDPPVPMSLVGFADTNPKEYTRSTLLKDLSDALRAHIFGVGHYFGDVAPSDSPVDTSIHQVIKNHRPPDSRERFQVLVEQVKLFRVETFDRDAHFANSIRLHSDGTLPTADVVKTFLAEVRAKYPNDPALCERKTIEKFCPTLAKQINQAEKTATEKIQAEQKRLVSEQAQKQIEAEKQAQEARARQETIAQHNEKIVTDEMAKTVTASTQNPTSGSEQSAYAAIPEDRASFSKQHFTPDAEGRLQRNAPDMKPDSEGKDVQTDRITDVFKQNHIDLANGSEQSQLGGELTSKYLKDNLVGRLNESINQAIDEELKLGKTYGEVYDAMHDKVTQLVLNLHKEFTTDTVRATKTEMFSYLLEHLNSPALLLATRPEDAAKLARMTVAAFTSPISLKHVYDALSMAVQPGTSPADFTTHLQELSRNMENLSYESVKFAKSYLGPFIESRYEGRLTLKELKYLAEAGARILDSFNSQQNLSTLKPEDMKKQLQDFQKALFDRLDDAVATAPYSGSNEEVANMETVVSTAKDELYKKINRNGDGKEWLELIGGADWQQKMDAHAQSLAPKLRQLYIRNVAIKSMLVDSLQDLKKLTHGEFARIRSQVQDLMPELLAIRPYTTTEMLPREVAAGYFFAEQALLDKIPPSMEQDVIKKLNEVISSAMRNHVIQGTFSRDFAPLGITAEEGKSIMLRGITELSMGKELFSPEAMHKQMRRKLINTVVHKLDAFQTGKAALGDEMDKPLEGLEKCFDRAFTARLVTLDQMGPVVKAVFDGYQAMLKASTAGGLLSSHPAAKLFKEQKSFPALEKSIEELTGAGSAPLRAIERQLGFKFPQDTIPEAVKVMCRMLSTHLQNIDAQTSAGTTTLWKDFKKNCYSLAATISTDQYKARFATSKKDTHDDRVVIRCHKEVMSWISDVRNDRI